MAARRRGTSRRWRAAAPLVVAALVLVLTWLPGGLSSAALFRSARGVAGTFATPQAFSAPRVTAAHEVRDSSSGTEVNATDKLAAGDGNPLVTAKGWPAAFDANRYVELRFSPSLPGGLGITDARLEITSAAVSGDRFCYYLDFFWISTGASNGTVADPANPVCATGSLTFVLGLGGADATTSGFNDMGIRIVGKVNTAGNKALLDQATLRGTVTVGGTATDVVQHADVVDEHQDGVSSDQSYFAVKDDAQLWTSNAAWPTARSDARYLSAVFPYASRPAVFANAQVSRVRLLHAWRPSGSSSACYDVQVYTGGTRVGGTDPASPTCRAAGSAASQDAIDLTPWVGSAATVNALAVRLHYRSGDGATRVAEDRIALEVTWRVP